jgi:hypothetical protein
MKFRNSESGVALVTVLTVIAGLSIVVAILMNQTRSDMRPWVLETERTQATYAAESGIAYQLYLERFSDSTDPEFKNAGVKDSLDRFAFTKPSTEAFKYFFDSDAIDPEVNVDRTRTFLDITATGHYRNAAATVFARFGKALDDSVFGPALTLENAIPLETFSSESIVGPLRVKLPPQGIPSEAWPANFTITNYASEFTDKKYHALEASLHKKLTAEGGQSGSGSFSPESPPKFDDDHNIFFPLGRVELTNNGQETWVLRGPGRIFADGEIRIRGHIRLENIQLLSGKDITFEDSISGEENSAFARGSIFFHDRCHLGIEALAVKDILLRDQSQTSVGSVLITVGNRHPAKGADSLNAIRIVNHAIARGFLIAAGPSGRIVIGTPANTVEGVVMASSVWLAGLVKGPVLTQMLLCEVSNQRNCLGSGRINRSQLPPSFVQPLQLGPSDRRKFVFKLMDWRRI